MTHEQLARSARPRSASTLQDSSDALDRVIAEFSDSTDPRLMAEMTRLYEHSIATDTLEHRQQRYLKARGEVAEFRAPVNLLQPFWMTETHRQVVSSATLDFLMMRPVTTSGSLASICEILEWYDADTLGNRGAALAAIALTGDRRVAELLHRLRVQPDQAAAGEIVMTQSGVIFGPTVDIYLQWIENAADSDDGELIMVLEQGLANMVHTSSGESVLEVERDFGLQGDQAPVSLVSRTAFASYRDEAIERFELLAASYPVPGGLATAISTWRSKSAPN